MNIHRVLMCGLAVAMLAGCGAPKVVVGGGISASIAKEDADVATVDGLALRELSESSDVGYVARVHGGIQVSRGWAAIVELEYTDVTFDYDGRDVDATALSTFGNLRYTLDVGLPLRPYAKVGAGYALSLEGEREDSLGIKGAVGVLVDLSDSVALYGEAHYVEFLSSDFSITGVGIEAESATYGIDAGLELSF